MRSPTNCFSCCTNKHENISIFLNFSPKFSYWCWNMFLVGGTHMIVHILWLKWEIIFTARDITCGYINTAIFAWVIQNTDLLICYESTMTNTKFPVSFSNNYSSNYVTHGTSHFSITQGYQKEIIWEMWFVFSHWYYQEFFPAKHYWTFPFSGFNS